MVLRGYRDGTDPKDADGWLPTNDAGEWADDGRLVVHGRRGDLIITGGENVWPTAVERVLATHPAVAEVAVDRPGRPRVGRAGRGRRGAHRSGRARRRSTSSATT